MPYKFNPFYGSPQELHSEDNCFCILWFITSCYLYNNKKCQNLNKIEKGVEDMQLSSTNFLLFIYLMEIKINTSSPCLHQTTIQLNIYETILKQQPQKLEELEKNGSRIYSFTNFENAKESRSNS